MFSAHRLICGALTLLLAAPLAAGRRDDTLVLALVRDDGIVLPVVTYASNRWDSPWPGPEKEATVPGRLDECPLDWWSGLTPPATWQFLSQGRPARTIAIDGVTWVLDHCRQQVALRSRAAVRDPLRLPDGLRAPKHGVAFAGTVPVTLPREVASDSPEGRELLDAVHQSFNEREVWLMLNVYAGWHVASLDARARAQMPVQALSIHEGQGRDGAPVYFVELQRSYPRKRPESLRWCDEVTVISGWVVRDRSDRVKLVPTFQEITSCLREYIQRSVPHAIMTAPGEDPVWLMEEYQPGAESYVLYRGPGGLVAPRPLLRRTSGDCLAH